jgi:hypothetical protein
MSIKDTYYPSKISLKVLKNKIYCLQFDQHGRTTKKILTKAACIAYANDPKNNAAVRDVIIEAFEAGVIE